MSMILGKNYSRGQIRDFLGGGELQSYLPSSGGTILGGCFDPKLNRRAPREIDVGGGVRVVERAQRLAMTKAELPVFLKHRSNEWEYVGVYRGVSFSQAKKDLTAYADRRKDAVGVLYLEQVVDHSTEEILDPELLELSAIEGKKRLVSHIMRERRRDLIIAKRNEVRADRGCLICEACGITSRDFPRDIAEAPFEVHHNIPLADLAENVRTRLVDLSLLCANCHRMIHRTDPILPLGQFRKLFASE